MLPVLLMKKNQKILWPSFTKKKLFPDFPANEDYHQPQHSDHECRVRLYLAGRSRFRSTFPAW
jgi:hypothetical protein